MSASLTRGARAFVAGASQSVHGTWNATESRISYLPRCAAACQVGPAALHTFLRTLADLGQQDGRPPPRGLFLVPTAFATELRRPETRGKAGEGGEEHAVAAADGAEPVMATVGARAGWRRVPHNVRRRGRGGRGGARLRERRAELCVLRSGTCPTGQQVYRMYVGRKPRPERPTAEQALPAERRAAPAAAAAAQRVAPAAQAAAADGDKVVVSRAEWEALKANLGTMITEQARLAEVIRQQQAQY